MKSIPELAKEALDIQDGCNLSGLSKRFPLAIQELADNLRAIGEFKGTDQINQHPITRMWVDKLCHLARIQFSDNSSFNALMSADRWCREQAELVTPVSTGN